MPRAAFARGRIGASTHIVAGRNRPNRLPWLAPDRRARSHAPGGITPDRPAPVSVQRGRQLQARIRTSCLCRHRRSAPKACVPCRRFIALRYQSLIRNDKVIRSGDTVRKDSLTRTGDGQDRTTGSLAGVAGLAALPALAQQPGAGADWFVLTDAEAAFLGAAMARSIPADELTPSATDLGGVRYLDRQLAPAGARGGRRARGRQHAAEAFIRIERRRPVCRSGRRARGASAPLDGVC